MARKNDVAEVLSSLGKVEKMKSAAAQEAAAPSTRYKSRFFFVLDETILARRKAQYAPKVLEHVDSDAEKRLAKYKPKALPVMEANTKKVRAFFLKEIAPLLLTTSAGAKQAHDVVEKLIDAKVDTTLASNFDAMVIRAARMRLALFVAELFKLPKSAVEELLGPQAQPQDRKLTSVLDDLIRRLDKNSEGINVLTNQVTNEFRKLRRDKAG